jgi:GNAT superfamily N-acetyltransferase
MVPPQLRRQVVALQEQAWPSDDPAAAAGVVHDPAAAAGVVHDPALRPVSLLLVDDVAVLAALDILSKDLSHRGRRYAASGISTVVTDPTQRRRGHGRRLVTAAREAMQAGGADVGIFTCDRPLQAFYQSAGWCLLPNAVLVGGTLEEPFPSDRLDKVVMACFFSERAQRHARSFDHARIELYPGRVDKLW